MHPLSTGLRRRELVLAAAGAATFGRAAAQAAYPTKPIRLVLPHSPGSSVDNLARKLAPLLAARLGQAVVIDNQAGSGGVIGIQQIIRSNADGYTVGHVSSNYAILPHLYKLPYDPRLDIVPVAVLTTGPYILVTHARLAVRNAQELIAMARTRAAGAAMTYGTPGVGTSFHLAGELMKSIGGIDLLHVPYRGVNTLTTDLVSGVVDCGFLSPSSGLPMIRTGKLRALAVSSANRTTLLPDTPTLAESGLAGYQLEGWQAIIVERGTPAAVIERLSKEINHVLRQPEVLKALEDDGQQVVGGSPQAAADWFQRDLDKYAALARAAGIKPD
jgi:tripartite-type tricarboxylate transporter receptor subunit TctC